MTPNIENGDGILYRYENGISKIPISIQYCNLKKLFSMYWISYNIMFDDFFNVSFS